MSFMQDSRLILESLRQIDDIHSPVTGAPRRIRIKLQGRDVEVWCQDENLAHQVDAMFANLRRSGYTIRITIGEQLHSPVHSYPELAQQIEGSARS